MTLREYIDKYGMPISVLAKRCGTSRHTIYRAMIEKITYKKIADKIVEQTQGLVSLEQIWRQSEQGQSPRGARGRWRSCAKPRGCNQSTDSEHIANTCDL